MSDNAGTSTHPDVSATNDASVEQAVPAQPPAEVNSEDAAAAAAAEAQQQQMEQAEQADAEKTHNNGVLITERYSIDEDLFNELTGMGYSANAVKKSIMCGCIDSNTCQQWLQISLDHPDLNADLEPHVEVTVKKKRVLTEAERAAKVEELKQKIIETKKREEVEGKKSALDAEKARIRNGKLALEAKEQRDARARQQIYEDRRREKEADRIAKEKLHLEMQADKLVRQGMTREDAVKKAHADHEEAKAEAKRRAAEDAARLERERQEAAAINARDGASNAGNGAAKSAGWNLSHLVGEADGSAPSGGAPSAGGAGSGDVVLDFDRDVPVPQCPAPSDFLDVLRKADELAQAKHGANDGAAVALVARETLSRVVQAIIDQPLERKVRTLRATSKVFTHKLLPMPLSCAFLRLCGFQEASSTPELAAAGASDQMTMHVALLPKLRMAREALDAMTA